MINDTEEPAFPQNPEVTRWPGQQGMSLRDYFAAKALPMLISNVETLTAKQLSKYTPQEACSVSAYMYADAMLEARK